MVFTHLPSGVLLTLIPLPAKAGPAIAIIAVRAFFQSMDTAPRTAFMADVTAPNERTAVMGIINVIKTMSQGLGPVVTGVLADRSLFGVSFVIAGVIKVVYDFGVLAVFAGHKSQQKKPELEAVEDETHSD